MKKLAIIPARGGSKRIPQKNINPFLGKPIIAYSIIAAQESGLFDEVMVSTDDVQIAGIAEQYGAVVPFMRSASTSGDHAATVDVLIEVLDDYQKIGKAFDYACCIYPTAPFVTAKMLREAYDLLLQKDFLSVFPVMQYSYPIWRSLKIDSGRLTMNYPEHEKSRSQDLPPAYHDAGQFYIFKTEELIAERTLFTSNSGAVVISEIEGQDIDCQSDWELAEMKYKLLKEQHGKF